METQLDSQLGASYGYASINDGAVRLKIKRVAAKSGITNLLTAWQKGIWFIVRTLMFSDFRFGCLNRRAAERTAGLSRS